MAKQKDKSEAPASSAGPSGPSGSSGSAAGNLDGDAGSVRSRRQPGRRDLGEKVQRALDLHFSDMALHIRESKNINNDTLREKIAADMGNKSLTGKAGRLGASYWRSLREHFCAGESIEDMEVKDKKMAVSSGCSEGLAAAMRTNPGTRTHEPLAMWLQTTPTLNQREVVGLMKALAKRENFSNNAADLLVIDLMKCITRLDKRGDFSAEILVFKSICDRAVANTYSKLKQAGVSLQTFLSSHAGLLDILIPETDLKPILNCKGNWTSVAAQVARTVTSGSTGKVLFSHACTLIDCQGFQLSIEQVIHKYIESDKSMDQYDAACKQLTRDAAIITATKVLAQRRLINIIFLNTAMAITAQDAGAEW